MPFEGPFIRRKGVWRPNMVPTGPVELDRKNPLSDALVGYYIPGVTRRDFSDFSADLTVSSGITAVSPTSYGPGLYFDGSASYVAAQKNVYPYTSTHNLNTLTLSALLYLPTTPTILSQFLTLGYPQDGNHPTGLMYYGGSDLNYGGNNWQVDSGTPPPIGSVFLFTAVTDYSAGTLTMYVNDKAVYGPTVVTPTSSLNGPATLNLSYWGKYSKVSYVAASVWKRALSPDQVVEFAGNPFSLLRPRTVRRYYAAASAPGTNSLAILGGLGPIGGGFVATQASSATLAGDAIVGAAIEATQSQSISSDGALRATVADWVSAQQNATTLDGVASNVETSASATQAQSATIGASTAALVSAWSGAQSQTSTIDGSLSPASASWSVIQANIVSVTISATILPIASSIAAQNIQTATATGILPTAESNLTTAQSQEVTISGDAFPVASVWTLAQANLTTLAIDATLSAIQSGVSASQAQGVTVFGGVPRVSAGFAAAIAQSASLDGRALPLVGSVTVANTNAVTLVVNAVLGRVTAAAALSQSQRADIQAIMAPLVSAWSSIGLEVSPYRIAVWPVEQRIAMWPVENRIARIAA